MRVLYLQKKSDLLGHKGEGIRPSTLRGTVNRGTIYIDLHIKFFFVGKIEVR